MNAGSADRSPARLNDFLKTFTVEAELPGSLVGGSATVATAWITQRTLSKRELISAEIRKGENAIRAIH